MQARARASRALLSSLLVIAAIATGAQRSSAADDPSDSRLLWPLEERTCVTGSFGEYRSNHFHAGIDISTGGRIGLPVRAPAAGRVVRLRASPYGYGKVIYIDLDDPERGSAARGRQIVCAHLSDFAPRWRSLVEAQQERLGKYAVDFAVTDSPRVAAGEIVAYTGETGGGPPHLHFEVREGDAAPIDPLTHGWVARDREPPLVSAVRLVPLGLDGRIDGGLDPVTIDVARSKGDGIYRPASREAMPHLEGRVGVQVLAWDPGTSGCDARRGIQGATLRVGDELLFDWEIDRIVYDVDFNLIHERYDYASRIGNDRFVRLYDRVKEQGALFFDGEATLEIEVRDSAGNASRVRIASLSGRRENGELERLERALDAGAPGICVLPPAPRGTKTGRGALRVDSEVSPHGVVLFTTDPMSGALFVESGIRPHAGEFEIDRSDSIAGGSAGGGDLWYVVPRRAFPRNSWLEGWTRSGGEPALRVVWRRGSSDDTRETVLELGVLASLDDGEEASLTTRDANSEVGAKWTVPKGALLGDAFVATSSAVAAPDLAPGLTLHGRPFRAEPMDLPLRKQIELTPSWPRGVPNTGRLGVFRVWSDGEIEPLSAGSDGSVKTWLLGTFAIIEDQSPPQITRIRPARGAAISSTRPELVVDVIDAGKGIDDEATRFFLDGKRLIPEYDPEANVIKATPKEPLSRGAHTFEVTIRDEAGHETSAASDFTVVAAKKRSGKRR